MDRILGVDVNALVLCVMYHQHLKLSFTFDSWLTTGVSTWLLVPQEVPWGLPKGWTGLTRGAQNGLLLYWSDLSEKCLALLLKAGESQDFVLMAPFSQLKSKSIWQLNGFHYIYSSSKYLLSISYTPGNVLETGMQQWTGCVSVVNPSEGILVIM